MERNDPQDRGVRAIEAELEAEGAVFAGPARWSIAAGTAVAIGIAVNQLFNLRIAGYAMLEEMYLYLLAGIFLAITFLCYRVRGKVSPRIPWYDWLLALTALLVAGYFALTTGQSLDNGWEYAAPETAVWFSVVLYALILEAMRRAGGLVLFAIVLLFSLYPTFAEQVPDPLSGFTQPFLDVVPYFMISSEASFGIPMQAFGSLVIGFILFGAVLQFTGGGRFFNDIAMGLVGHYRGGAAKVSIFASGLMGSMSGSVISNVLTTGVVSIPAMKRSGFSARFAAATEACASTGGVLMPPIMGATAFVMASWLGLPYVEIMLAAVVPSALYYFGLFVQIDAYAARRGLRGLPRSELPRVGPTLRGGWVYISVFALLIFLMTAFRWETTAPFYAILLLLVVDQIRKGALFSARGFVDLLVSVGRTLAEIVAILLGIGMIIGAFQATGLTGPLATELVHFAGDSVPMLLLMGALTSFVFGMGMTVTACYIFLAIVLAPALVQAGLNELAVHLFILYWGVVSFITPPVALGAFAAATMAGANPISTGWEATRLGAVIYLVPFFFVANPALIGLGAPGAVVLAVVCAFAGIWFVAAAMQGYLAFVGTMGSGPAAIASRLLLAFAGVLVAAPVQGVLGLSQIGLSLVGLVLAIPPVLCAWRANRAEQAQKAAST
ncbi:TRAP transporter, 4TM/12TM fusion protein [Tistlia consotensis]|uniref:TRAP transporter, 4TM/12TM fusion protein n=1 Tax=Tistlia consotensis USBA 355 TaxID=560819 RepID=A0A1Y6B5U4_9PROT|nr:TRAP transporter fused permease subunit [Tistlia consotensis]SME89360.1 TRAP transporter, 4TM/12TM fusion protein [Tistlia consotensis USBA 355]SNR25903.1 TRAP transporter, 4TM/12TM fusion protein [Tistlia consotensis]